jgi:prolyl-tRNA editing enzyme YbaK/EbsC (Cys-tRNA(Pro) deacylase)
MDEDLLRFGEVWAAAGTPRAVFPVAPAELARAIGVEPVRVGVR